MSVEEEYNVATRYRTVRKHLDSLGYQQALTLDALPLIEKLLADLIKTTESLKHFKSIAQENIEAHTQLQSIVDPYKCDNVRLVQECNQLHLDFIKEKDNHQKQIKDLKKEIHKLERECSDLQLASSRNLHRIKELETESAKKSKRILELQGKCLKPTVSNVGLATKKRPIFPLRRPALEIEPLPKSGVKTSPLPNLSTVEPKVVDLLKMADHKMNCLSHEVIKLKEELSLEIDNVETLKCQLTTKEKEILRLKKMLEGGRPYSAVSKDCTCKKGESSYTLSSHSAGVNELKVLQEEKLELEQQLKEALEKQHDAMTQALKLADRNEELEKELRDIDHIALALEADCNSAVKENNKRVSRLQVKLEDVMTRIHVLEGELTIERREVQELKADLDACRLEKLSIQRNLESALDEKKHMTDRINELTVIESNLNEEIGRMAKENERQKQDIIQLQYSNKMLKDQLNSKQPLSSRHDTDLKASKDKNKYNDYNREQNSGVLQEIYKETKSHINGSIIGYNNMVNQLEQKDTELNDLQQVIQQLRRERDLYKNEYNSIKSSFDKTTDQDHNIIERLEHERDMARADVDRLIEERDALRERLKMAAEAHTSEQRRLRESLTDVESRLKQIEKERQELLHTQGTRRATITGLEDQLQDVREELRRTKQELSTQRTQYFQLRALQDQTDQALSDVQNQLTQSESELNNALDRNRAAERQQLQLESQVKELQLEISNLKSNLAHLDHEKDQLLMALDEKTEKIATLEHELILKEQQIMESGHQIRELQHKNELCVDQTADQSRQMRSMQLDMENLQRQLQTITYDRENAIQENRRIQDDLAAVTCEVRNLQRELEASRAESMDLKRQLQTYVSEVRRAEELLNRKENERTEMLNHFRSLSLEATVLENSNHGLESEAAEARAALQAARDRMLDLEQQLADKENLIRGYETQISELSQNVACMETQLRQGEEQKYRAEADLTAVRDLCMKLDQQKDTLMQQLDSKDALKSQYDMQIAKLKAEQAVIQDQMCKDRATVERLEMLLDQARQESINVQANNQELQNEMSRLRSKVTELQNKLSMESTKLRQYQTQAAEYCKQISELRRQVTNERFDRARKEEENRRYSQNETCRESDDRANRSVARTVHPVTVSYCKRSNGEIANRCNRTKEFHRNVPCINIILRTDCKTRSNVEKSVQKGESPIASTRSLLNQIGSTKNDSKSLSSTLKHGSSCWTYDNVIDRAIGRVNLLQSTGLNARRETQGTLDSDIHDIFQTTYTHFPSYAIDSASSRALRLESINRSKSGPLTMLPKNEIKPSINCNELTAKLNMNKFMRYPTIADRSFPATKFDSNVKELKSSNGFSKRTITNLSNDSEKFDAPKEESLGSSRTRLKSILKNSINFADAETKAKPTGTLLNFNLERPGYSCKRIRDYKPFQHTVCVNSFKSLDDNNNLAKSNEFCDASNCRNYNSAENGENTVCITSTTDPKKLEDRFPQETDNFCTNKSCTGTGGSASEKCRQNEYNNKSTIVKSNNHSCWLFKKNLQLMDYENKCIGTVDSALNILQNVLNDVQKFRGNNTIKRDQEAMHRHKEVRCKNTGCNEPGTKCKMSSRGRVDRSSSRPPEITEAGCIKMLEEIKQRTESFEEQLLTMNKNIRAGKKLDERSERFSENCIRKQRKDIFTQNPGKRNIYVQEPCRDSTCMISPKNMLTQAENTFPFQTVKHEDVPVREINAKCVREEQCREKKDYAEMNSKQFKYPVVKKVREVKNTEIQCVMSSSPPTLDSPGRKLLVSSTCRELSISKCTQTNPPTLITEFSAVKDSYLNRQKTDDWIRKAESIHSASICGGVCSNCDENDVVMFMLTNPVNSNKCMKSRYKRLKFLNFRPKCIASSCAAYDHKLIRCKSSRRKAQIPVALKLKAASCKAWDVNRDEEAYDELVMCSTKCGDAKDFDTTVCTQSSNTQITTATSVQSIPFYHEYPSENALGGRTARRDGCRIS